MRILINNGVLIGRFDNGTPIFINLNENDLAEITENWANLTEDWLMARFYPEMGKKDNLKKAPSKLEQTGLFTTMDNLVYYNGIDLSLPPLLIQELVSELDTLGVSSPRFTALINFWKLCSLNPNPRARQDLFKFLEGGRFTITSSGLFVAYRNVSVKKEGVDRKLAEFVNMLIPKIKAWKKSTGNFAVTSTAEGYGYFDITKRNENENEKVIGSVLALQDKLEDEVEYTDNHTKTFSIKIGKPVSMPREHCDNNAGVDCSYGLHLGNRTFLRPNDFGNVGLICLCNPYNVVSVPLYNSNKLRCCEYLPVGVVEYDSSGNLVEVDTLLYEDDYCQFTVEQINEMLRTHNMEEYTLNTLFEVGEVTTKIRDLANTIVCERNINWYDNADDSYDEDDDYYDEE